MKRALAALATLGIAAMTAAPSMAATTVYGSAQLKYTVNATAQVSIATNYDATGNQQTTAPSILSSAGAGCTAPAAETAATITFAGITPGTATANGCYYRNALSIGVLSNDALGVKVIEYVDVLQTGETICMYNTDTSFKAAPTTTTTAAAGTPAAYSAGACQSNGGTPAVTGAKLVALGVNDSGGTGFGAPGSPPGVTTAVNATPLYKIYTAGGTNVCPGSGVCTGTTGAAWKFMGQDIQLNADGTASSGAAANVITVAVIPQ
ncbi:MAG: hypothetical protein NVS3B7_20420 [Candidatus Elarobacter sp.]